MARFWVVFLSLALSGCNSAQWATDRHVVVNRSTPCSKAVAFDALALATVTATEAPVEKTYSVWPGARVKMTPMIVDVERELRGDIVVPGRFRVMVGAPLDPNRLEIRTYAATPLNVRGWLFFLKIDDDWVADLAGLATSSSPTRFDSHVGNFDSEAEFEAELRQAIVDCPRTDFLFLDGGGRRGGPTRDRYLERVEAEGMSGFLVDGGRK
jgi:hypothetical protein